MLILSIKIDVDTERGTRIGVPKMLALFRELKIPATFLFSLGPDNTGRAIKRIFRPGFLKKVSRSGVVSTYGLRTLMNGVLLPGPHIGKKHGDIMRQVFSEGHEVGIHCYDHIRWQDGLAHMSQEEVLAEFQKALDAFQNVFQFPAKTAGAAGWQANAFSLEAYDRANLLYGSDGRGTEPFFPRVEKKVFKTLQIPTTLPTLDELLGRPEFPYDSMNDHYQKLLQSDRPNIFTTHAEIEGMKHLEWFENFLRTCLKRGVKFVSMETIAQKYLSDTAKIPVCEMLQGTMDGRSGTLAVQGN